jgi:sortase A
VIGRKQLGIACCLAGGMLLSVAGGRYAMGAVRADAARTAWHQQQARRAVERAWASVSEVQLRGPRIVGAPVARLAIPRIGLDEIVLEGVGADQLDAEPGHVPGSAVPGDAGNAIISAHRDRHFRGLGRLAVGDTIITDSDAGYRTWVLTGRRVIDKDAPALFHTTDATLTLTTCWPIRYIGPAPDRLILTAKLVGAGT